MEILGQHINQENQSHEVLIKLVGRTDTRVPNVVEVTVLQLSIPLLHEIDPQTPQTQVEEQVKLQATSSQTLNPQKDHQNISSQARDKAEMHQEREPRELGDKKENRNVPKQPMDRFNCQKFHRNQKKRTKLEEVKYAMKLEMTPNLEETNIKKE